jgi:hypothetical protein
MASMADDFTRRRFQWLDQVAADPAVTAAGFVLAYRIAKHLNRGTGDAWPSQATLAAEARMTVRGVRGLSDQLEAGGHLSVVASQGRGHSCRYRPVLRDVQDEPAPMPEATAFAPGELFPETIEAGSKPAPISKKDFTADFEAWWLQYPRKVSKGAAVAAYDRARNGGTTGEELEIGAMRYSAARTGEDPKYTKHPASWLNQKCWLDEPELPRSASFDNRPPSGLQRPAPQSHLEIALAALNGDE